MLRSTLLALLLVSIASGTSCGFSAFSDTERDNILKVHNQLRSSIAKGTYVAKTDAKPAGTNMQMMAWDCSVEQSAQSWADTCPSGHSGAAGKGENMYWSWSSGPISINGKGVDASNSWEKEFQDYGWASNNLTLALFNTGIGHATQMAWYNSNKIGCGVKNCPSSLAGWPYEVVVVCQYTAQGNFLNRNIYNSGTTCSACGTGLTCHAASGLCGAPGQIPVMMSHELRANRPSQ